MELEKCCVCSSNEMIIKKVQVHIEEYNFVYDYYCNECIELAPITKIDEEVNYYDYPL